jgi:hypothetical protein
MPPTRTRRIAQAAAFGWAFCTALAGFPVQAQSPLSAIDWLSESVSTAPAATTAPPPDEPPITRNALPEDVSVSVIGAASPDGAGLLAPAVTGLPAALWGLGRTDEIAMALARARPDTLPSLQGLLLTLLLAEAEPPSDAGGAGTLLLARIDKLLEMGALEQAAALIEAAGGTGATLGPAVGPALFRRNFDVALLTGQEDAACQTLRDNPTLAPTLPARIFCLARSGDWNAAALTLETAQAIGQITPDENALLTRFLDPELSDGEPPLPPPERMSPLNWRLYEAIGEVFATSTLPVAFAHAELRPTAGWKSQVEAAERLARAGAIAPNRLLGVYTEREAAASGGVWDRVDAFQAADAALSAGDAAAASRTLPAAWARMGEAELEVPFSELQAAAAARLSLQGDAAGVALRMGLLSAGFAEVAARAAPVDPTEAFLIALARGQTAEVMPPDSLARIIAPAFQDAPLSPEVLALLAEGRKGELILLAIERITTGIETDRADVTEGLALLRRLGLETVARRAALELMILERRG